VVTPRILLLLLLALAGLAIATGMRAPAPPVTNDVTATDTGTFTEGFLEHLRTVQVAADALVDLGERRERNLLIVGQRQSAMNAALDDTDSWLARQIAHQDDPAVVSYRSGAALIRQAMADAQSAFLHLDWDGIAAANETLGEGVIEIHTAEVTVAAGNVN
jgi:hypothetical protein